MDKKIPRKIQRSGAGGLLGELLSSVWRSRLLGESHTEHEIHRGENTSHLIQIPPSEVLDLKHFVFSLLGEFADGLDSGVFQAVV
jgi:hypothetical protein